MIVVKDTQVPVKYTITPPTVLDARGNPVPGAQLVYKVAADPAAVVAIVPDATDPLSGMAGPFNDNPDGTPATCGVTVGVFLADGVTMVGSFGKQFTVTAGDPAAIQGGDLVFDGLADAEQPAGARRR
jgi:hypothetical protein